MHSTKFQGTATVEARVTELETWMKRSAVMVVNDFKMDAKTFNKASIELSENMMSRITTQDLIDRMRCTCKD